MEVIVFIVGLSLFTVPSGGHPIAILPKFDINQGLPNGGGILVAHDRLIVFPDDAYDSKGSNWTVHHDLWPNYGYVRVGKEEVTFTGSGGTPKIPGSLPHLQGDCCPKMRAIKPEFLPGTPGEKAIVHIDHGKLRGTTAHGGAAVTEWKISLAATDTTITIQTDTGHKLVLKAPTEIYIENRPFSAIQDPAHHTPGGFDFQAYYLLGDGSETCATHPTSAKPGNCKPGPASAPARPRWLPKNRWTMLNTILTVDSECSNSQYP